jgi:hypothetical protein
MCLTLFKNNLANAVAQLPLPIIAMLEDNDIDFFRFEFTQK